MIGVENIVVEDVSFDEDAQTIRPYRPHSCRCGKCGQKAPCYDAGRGTRHWRCPDVVGTKAYMQADAFKVRCPKCGTAVRKLPWADHRSWLTRAFEDTCCWPVLSMSKLACQKLLRILWRWVSAICSRVLARLNLAQPPKTAGLRRIGVDETSYKKGHSYMTGIAARSSTPSSSTSALREGNPSTL